MLGWPIAVDAVIFEVSKFKIYKIDGMLQVSETII